MNHAAILPPEPAPARSSLVSRLVNIFAAPGDVFEEVKASPPSTANWLVPVLVFILASWIGAGLMFSSDAVNQQMRDMRAKAMEKRLQTAPKEQAEAIAQAAEKWGEIAGIISAGIGAVAIGFAGPFWWGLIFWLVGAKMFKADFPFMKAVEVAGLASLIAALDAVVKGLVIVVTGNLFASPSLILLVKEINPQNPLHILLGLANVTLIWLLCVRAVGLARLGGLGFGKAAAWTFGVWALYALPMIGIGLAVQAAFSR